MAHRHNRGDEDDRLMMQGFKMWLTRYNQPVNLKYEVHEADMGSPEDDERIPGDVDRVATRQQIQMVVKQALGERANHIRIIGCKHGVQNAPLNAAYMSCRTAVVGTGLPTSG